MRGNTVPSGSAFDLTSGYITVAESQASGSSSNHQLVDNPAGPAGQTPAQQLAGANTGSTGVVGGVNRHTDVRCGGMPNAAVASTRLPRKATTIRVKGVGYQTLLRQFVADRVYEEEKREGILK